MDIFDSTRIHDLFTTYYRALTVPNNKPKLCHSSVILCPSIKPHVGILIQGEDPQFSEMSKNPDSSVCLNYDLRFKRNDRKKTALL
jgi:hypothetical protein